jgi:hypothetical protein
MSSCTPLPACIIVRPSAGGQRYRLPRRRTPTVRLQVLLMALVGAPMLVASIYLMLANLGPIPDALGFLLSVCSVTILAWALASITCRSSVQLASGRLTLTEWFGPIPLRRVRPLEHVRRLVICRVQEGEWAKPPHNGVLEVVCQGSQSLWFAVGYPCDLLSSLAADLADHCGLPAPGEPRDLPAAVKVEGLFLDRVRDQDTFDQPTQPADSKVLVEQQSHGLTVLRIPPSGIHHLIVEFLILTLVFGLLALYIGEKILPGPLSPVMPLAVLAALGACVAHVCRRWTVLAVSGDSLSVLRTGGLLPPRERHWQRAAIREIRMGLSPARRRAQELCALYVYFHDGKKVGTCCGRDDNELAWLATILRQALHVPPVAHEPTE